MPGRPRKPAKLHILEGTYKAERHKEWVKEIETGAIGDPPEWMDEIAKSEWIRLTTNAVYGKLLQASDVAEFIQYCVLFSRMILDAQGVAPMSASERNTFHSLCMQLGMTPAARSKVMLGGESKKKNKFDAVVNG